MSHTKLQSKAFYDKFSVRKKTFTLLTVGALIEVVRIYDRIASCVREAERMIRLLIFRKITLVTPPNTEAKISGSLTVY